MNSIVANVNRIIEDLKQTKNTVDSSNVAIARAKATEDKTVVLTTSGVETIEPETNPTDTPPVTPETTPEASSGMSTYWIVGVSIIVILIIVAVIYYFKTKK